jgi:hypothetical protein
VARPVAVVFGQQVDLEVGDQRPGAQKVVPHQAVEVEGGRRADIDLNIGDLGYRAYGLGQGAGDTGGLL